MAHWVAFKLIFKSASKENAIEKRLKVLTKTNRESFLNEKYLTKNFEINWLKINFCGSFGSNSMQVFFYIFVKGFSKVSSLRKVDRCVMPFMEELLLLMLRMLLVLKLLLLLK